MGPNMGVLEAWFILCNARSPSRKRASPLTAYLSSNSDSSRMDWSWEMYRTKEALTDRFQTHPLHVLLLVKVAHLIYLLTSYLDSRIIDVVALYEEINHD
jgi:hypothetical protein